MVRHGTCKLVDRSVGIAINQNTIRRDLLLRDDRPCFCLKPNSRANVVMNVFLTSTAWYANLLRRALCINGDMKQSNFAVATVSAGARHRPLTWKRHLVRSTPQTTQRVGLCFFG